MKTTILLLSLFILSNCEFLQKQDTAFAQVRAQKD